MIEAIGEACRAKIGYSYIKRLIVESDERREETRVCVIQYLGGTGPRNIAGVAIMDLSEQTGIKKVYIHLFCTRMSTLKLGQQLLAYIKAHVCGECIIELDSVPEALGFYDKMGFVRKNNFYNLGLDNRS